MGSSAWLDIQTNDIEPLLPDKNTNEITTTILVGPVRNMNQMLPDEKKSSGLRLFLSRIQRAE